MRTAFAIMSQIACLVIIAYFGQCVLILLRYGNVITESVIYWYIGYGRFLYLLINVGLLVSALIAFIMSGQAKDNMIVVSESPVGRTLFSLWQTQNVIIATISIASFLYLYSQAPPDFRKYLLPSIFW